VCSRGRIRRAAHGGANVSARWHVQKGDDVIRRLRVLYRLQDCAVRCGRDSSAIDKRVRHAEKAVKRIRREMWRPIWGSFALPESGMRT
jgi:hypothetical protein